MFHGDAIAGGGSSASISKMIGNMRGVIQFKQALESTIVEHDGVMPGNFSDVMMGHFHRVDVMDIGTGSAYLVSFYEFPLCNFFKWSAPFKTSEVLPLSNAEPS